MLYLTILINFVLLTPIYLLGLLVALLINWPVFIWGTPKMKKYSLNVLLGIDQGENSVAGGSPDICISTRLWINYRHSIMRKFVDLILGDGHCERSAVDDDETAVLK